MNINDFITTTMQSMDFPLLTAFFLGLLTALNPCQLSINISALGYIIRSEAKNQVQYTRHLTLDLSLPYAVGRTITYTILGWTLMCLIGGGQNIEGFQQILSKAEIVLPHILIAVGLFFMYRSIHHHEHHGDNCHHSGQLIRRNGPLGSLILGMTLALAFCPESAIFYFGITIPMSMTNKAGILMPFIFGVAASIPVVVISWLMHKTVDKAMNYSRNFETFQRVLNLVTGIMCIGIAVLLFIE